METKSENDFEQVECSNCSSEIAESDSLSTENGDKVCESCYAMCDNCESGFSIDDVMSVDNGDSYYCQGCVHSHTFYCADCDSQMTGDYYTFPDTDSSFCLYHYEQSGNWCEHCEESYYHGCDENHNRVIHDYSYKPDPIFLQPMGETNKLFFGLEIETEVSESYDNNFDSASEYAQSILEKKHNIAYLKHDGSLDNGFEIVTHPMSYSYIMNDDMPLWSVLLDLKNDYNMRSWNARTCGLHIHVSRYGFTGGSHQHKFLQLIYNNREFYQLLAGRKSDNWATFDDVVDPETGKRTYKDKLNRRLGTNRYSAVNTNNAKTLEVRIFRGSLNPRFIKSAIDLIHASVEYTRFMSVKDVVGGAMSTRNFKEYILSKPELYVSLIQRIEIHNESISIIERNQHVSPSGVIS